MTTRPPVSVVLPTRDRADRLAGCLASVLSALRPGDELVVVDSASVDAAAVAQVVADARTGLGSRTGAPAVSLVRLELPGVNRARNAGWRAARFDLVLFTDDDVRVDPGWADAFAEMFVAYPGTGFCTGRVLPPAGEEEARRPVAVKDEPLPQLFDRGSVGNLGHGASVALSRLALLAVSGWDENLGAGGRFRSSPEVDLFDRVLGIGICGRYEPAALAYHPQWRTPRELVKLDYGYGYGNGARLTKLWRSDRPRARAVTGDALWGWGGAPLLAAIRAGDRLSAACVVSRLLGTARGCLAAGRYRLRDGHLEPRAATSSS